MKKILLLMLVSTIIFFSCKKVESEDVDQNKIRQWYTVTYYSQTNVTEVTASFRYKNGFGNPVLLSGNAQVKYGSTALQYRSSDRAYYAILNGQRMQEVFTYINNNNDTFQNVAPYIAPVNFNFGNNIYIDRQQSFSMGLANIAGTNWDNVVQLHFANKNFSANRYNNFYTVNITADQLSDISTGYYFGTISNSLSYNLGQHTNGGGRIIASYHSNAFGLQVY